jgi:hypothetical protein
MMPRLVLASILAALASGALAQASVPDPALTPGVINPDVTQANIQETICVRGWTRTIRPDRRYTQSLKRKQITALGYPKPDEPEPKRL